MESESAERDPIVGWAFVCGCDVRDRHACVGQSPYATYDQKEFCVFHYPCAGKGDAFSKALSKRLSERNYDFRGFYFPEHIKFRQEIFASRADFSYAVFEQGADFRGACFEDGVNFHAVHFKESVSFRKVEFNVEADFSQATFDSYVRFIGDADKPLFRDGCKFSLEFARVGKPERFIFHSTTLQPYWFMNVDIRKFEFMNVQWADDLRQEVETVVGRFGRKHAHALLSITYRRLGANAEESQDYRWAAEARYRAFELPRWDARYKDGIKYYHRELLWESLKGAWLLLKRRPANLWSLLIHLQKWVTGGLRNRRHRALFSITEFFWVMSGYSEKPVRAFVVLLLVLTGFAGYYCGSGLLNRNDVRLTATNIASAFAYSIETSLLRRPNTQPTEIWDRFVVAAETVIGPLQGALLALAIRRKFMR